MVDIPTDNYSSRNGARVIWVAIHTTEGIMDARDLGYYWQRIDSGSSHAGCDNTKTVTYIDPIYASWTLLNGNSRSVNMEICGWARWTRDEWLGPQKGRLIQAANWARQMCDRFGIPKRYIGSQGVARGEAGIIGHVDYTNGARDGNHWDPGPGFPWDVFISLVNQGSAPGGGGTGGVFLMALTDQEQRELLEGIRDIRNDLSVPWKDTGISSGNIIKYLYEAIADMRQNFSIPYVVNGEGKSAGEVIARLEGNLERIEKLIQALGSGVPGVDMNALVKAFADEQDRRDRDGDPNTGNIS
jgi:hypothetical protein